MSPMSHSAMAVSLTAPRLTEKDLYVEWSKLSVEEQESIAIDRYGHAAIPLFNYTHDETEHFVDQVKINISKSVDFAGKAAYHGALQACPDIVEKESNIVSFLRCEHYDTLAAAARLLGYWKMRKDVFGDRAYLPMDTLSGEGTLSQQDINAMDLFGAMMLPKDKLGRVVIYCCRQVFDKISWTADIMMRLFMYFTTLAGMDEHNQLHGYIIIMNKANNAISHVSRKLCRSFYHTAAFCLPIKLKAIHMCFPALKCTSKLLMPSYWWIMGPYTRQRAVCHNGRPCEVVMGLETYHVEANKLPEIVGGTLRKDYVRKWVEHKLDAELNLTN